MSTITLTPQARQVTFIRERGKDAGPRALHIAIRYLTRRIVGRFKGDGVAYSIPTVETQYDPSTGGTGIYVESLVATPIAGHEGMIYVLRDPQETIAMYTPSKEERVL